MDKWEFLEIMGPGRYSDEITAVIGLVIS